MLISTRVYLKVNKYPGAQIAAFHDDTQKYVSVFQFNSNKNTLPSCCYVKNEKQSSVLPDLIELSDSRYLVLVFCNC